MKIKFLRVFCCVSAIALSASGLQAQNRPTEKVLRYAFPIAETGFDPAQLSDVYSRIATANIFDALYTYDYLARPIKVRPNVAAGMPVVSDDFRPRTVKIKPGIFFSSDPDFGGTKRELTAYYFEDTNKRILYPKNTITIYSYI